MEAKPSKKKSIREVHHAYLRGEALACFAEREEADQGRKKQKKIVAFEKREMKLIL